MQLEQLATCMGRAAATSKIPFKAPAATVQAVAQAAAASATSAAPAQHQHAGGGIRVLVFNLFACEGFHIAERLSVPCCAAAPYPIPYACPSSFRSRFERVFPELYRRLTADCTADSSSPGSEIDEDKLEQDGVETREEEKEEGKGVEEQSTGGVTFMNADAGGVTDTGDRQQAERMAAHVGAAGAAAAFTERVTFKEVKSGAWE